MHRTVEVCIWFHYLYFAPPGPNQTKKELKFTFNVCLSQSISWLLSATKCGNWNWVAASAKKKIKQEWSSMESNSYENWDEIEMLFGHLVIGNWEICNWQFVIGNGQ